MSNSILTSTKKLLGVDEGYTVFDVDIRTHINSALFSLNQLGIGPDHGFVIEDATATWADFLGPSIRFEAVKTYVYLKVRLAFDPPATSFAINAIEAQIKEYEWRLSTQRELGVAVPIGVVLDGGDAVGG